MGIELIHHNLFTIIMQHNIIKNHNYIAFQVAHLDVKCINVILNQGN